MFFMRALLHRNKISSQTNKHNHGLDTRLLVHVMLERRERRER